MKSASGFPVKSNAFLVGQAILYYQFNDVDFYVEDQDQENLYFVILTKLFGNTVRITKIFPLNGVANVINEARIHSGNKRKIFIADRDFSHILKRQVRVPNLFYLARYSIENYFLEEQAIVEYILEQQPKIDRTDVRKQLNWSATLAECFKPFSQIVKLYIVIQKYHLQIPNAAQSIEKFCELNTRPSLRKSTFDPYRKLVATELKKNNPRIALKKECRTLDKHFRESKSILANLPGKILLLHLSKAMQRRLSLQSVEKDSFAYRLAKLCKFDSLAELKRRVELFRS